MRFSSPKPARRPAGRRAWFSPRTPRGPWRATRLAAVGLSLCLGALACTTGGDAQEADQSAACGPDEHCAAGSAGSGANAPSGAGGESGSSGAAGEPGGNAGQAGEAGDGGGSPHGLGGAGGSLMGGGGGGDGGASGSSAAGSAGSGSSNPVQVVPKNLAAGHTHSCAIQSSGAVICWGENKGAQLGSHKLTDSQANQTGAYDAKAIYAGELHSCYVDSQGNVGCWGANQFGQLGRPKLPHSACGQVPCSAEIIRPEELSGVEELALGYHHSCARSSDGHVRCWGANGYFELGHKDQAACASGPCQATPEMVPDLSDVTSLSAGEGFSCAVSKAQVYCWGRGDRGQLGTHANLDACPGNSPCSSTPIAIKDADHTFMVASGRGFACGLKTNGILKCWGDNTLGQLGHDEGQACPPGGICDEQARDVPLPEAATAVYAKGDRACALLASGKLYCWGANGYGQTGAPIHTPCAHSSNQLCSEEPTWAELLPAGLRDLALGSEHGCGRKPSGEVLCWGRSDNGQLGKPGSDQCFQGPCSQAGTAAALQH